MTPTTAGEREVLEIAQRYAARCAYTTRLRKIVARCRCWNYEPASYGLPGYPGSPSCEDLIASWSGHREYMERVNPTACSRCQRRVWLSKALTSAKAAERNTRRGLLSRVAKMERTK